MKNTITFDYIISNPPYEIGNIITKSIIDNTEFNNFINLMPVSQYKSNSLFRHVISIEHVDNMFDDANVATDLAIISKQPVRDSEISYEFFNTATYNTTFKKFYEKQALNRASGNFNNFKQTSKLKTNYADIKQKFEDSRSLFFQVTIYQDNSSNRQSNNISSKLNIQKVLPSKDDFVSYIEILEFADELSRDNACNWYIDSKIFGDMCNGLNKRSGIGSPAWYFPDIDWSRPWTDSEILADYGYTKEEIDTILHFNDDLKNATVNVAIEEENIENEAE